jgi:hypothetical protein
MNGATFENPEIETDTWEHPRIESDHDYYMMMSDHDLFCEEEEMIIEEEEPGIEVARCFTCRFAIARRKEAR